MPAFQGCRCALTNTGLPALITHSHKAGHLDVHARQQQQLHCPRPVTLSANPHLKDSLCPVLDLGCSTRPHTHSRHTDTDGAGILPAVKSSRHNRRRLTRTGRWQVDPLTTRHRPDSPIRKTPRTPRTQSPAKTRETPIKTTCDPAVPAPV